MELILISGDIPSPYSDRFNVMVDDALMGVVYRNDGSKVRRCHGEPRLAELLHLKSFGVSSVLIGTLVRGDQCVASFGVARASADDAKRAAELVANHIWG